MNIHTNCMPSSKLKTVDKLSNSKSLMVGLFPIIQQKNLVKVPDLHTAICMCILPRLIFSVDLLCLNILVVITPL